MTVLRRPLTFRARLTGWYASALTLVLSAYAFTVLTILDRKLAVELDRQVLEDHQAAEANVERTPGEDLRWREPSRAIPVVDRQDEPWIDVQTLDGHVVYRRRPARARTELPPMDTTATGYSSVVLADGTRVRLFRGQHAVGSRVVVIRAARDTAPFRRELLQLAVVLALGLPLGVLLASVGGYLVARRALAPVDAMVARAQRITADHLDERLPVPRADDELGRLAAAFNEMFARLQRSFEQLRQFTADAAHELRTPLTTIRTVGEVGLRKGEGVDQAHEVIASMLEEADRLGCLVDSLLTLARAEGGRQVIERRPIDLRAAADEIAAHLAVLADERGQRIVVEGRAGVVVDADLVVLRQAIVNVVANAIQFSPREADVTLVVDTERNCATLAVIDTGPGIAPEHLKHVFDRFYRVDPARRRGGGFGLGLAIARWAVEAQGGKIDVQSDEGRGSTFTIRLPTTREPNAHSEALGCSTDVPAPVAATTGGPPPGCPPCSE